MQDEVYSIYHLALDPADFPAFKALAEKIVAASSSEQDTLTYEYVASDDHKTAHIIERYRMDGVLPHVEQTFAPFTDAFLKLVRIEKLFVYGEPTPPIRAKLDGFGATYLAPFTGFTR